MKVEVSKTVVREVTGKNGANAGKQFKIPEVTAYVVLAGEPYPTKCTFGVERDAPHPAPGHYEIDLAASIFVDANGRLAFRNAPVLVPVKAK